MLLRAAFVLALVFVASESHAACMVGEKETATCNEDGSAKGSPQANPNAPDPTLAKFDIRRNATLVGRRFVGAAATQSLTSVTGPFWSGGAGKMETWCMQECYKLKTCVAASGQPASPWSWNTGTIQVQCKLYSVLPPQTSQLAYEPGWKHRWNCKNPVQKSSGTVPGCWLMVIKDRLPKFEKAPAPMVKKPGI